MTYPRKPIPKQQKALTKKANRSAAFIAVNMGDIERLDAAFIARCHGLKTEDVQAMIETRRSGHEHLG